MPRDGATTQHNSRRGHCQRMQWNQVPLMLQNTELLLWEADHGSQYWIHSRTALKGETVTTHLWLHPYLLPPTPQAPRLQICPWPSMKIILPIHYIQSLLFSRFIETSEPVLAPEILMGAQRFRNSFLLTIAWLWSLLSCEWVKNPICYAEMRNPFIVIVGLHPSPGALKSIVPVVGEPQGNNHSRRWKYYTKDILSDYLPYAYMLQTLSSHFINNGITRLSGVKKQVESFSSLLLEDLSPITFFLGSFSQHLGFWTLF